MTRLRKNFAVLSGVAMLAMVTAGCAEQQMARQPAPRPLAPSMFFADGTSARPLVQGTVSRGSLKYDSPGYDGANPAYNQWAQAAGLVGLAGSDVWAAMASYQSHRPLTDAMPFPVTEEVLWRGKQRFEIFCYQCHGYTGEGNGMVVQRGFARPPSYHEPRLREAPLGHFYRVITNGYGAMPAHNYLVPPDDRWKIAAYIRALQLSQHAPLGAVPEGDKQKLTGAGG